MLYTLQGILNNQHSFSFTLSSESGRTRSAGHSIIPIHTHPLISRVFIFHKAIPFYNSLPLAIKRNDNLASFRNDIIDHFSRIMLVGNDSLEINQFLM